MEVRIDRNRRRYDLGVGGFYNADFGPIPLTAVFGLRARINPVGMGIAWEIRKEPTDAFAAELWKPQDI
jgi:hypothetical protein